MHIAYIFIINVLGSLRQALLRLKKPWCNRKGSGLRFETGASPGPIAYLPLPGLYTSYEDPGELQGPFHL